MRKVNYYKINASISPDVTGIKSSKEQIIDFVDDGNTTQERISKYGVNHFELLDNSFDLNKFRAHIQAKPTDILSTAFLSADGFFISDKLKNILNDFNIANYQIIKTTIHGHQCNNWRYFYLNLAYISNTDYENSEFVINKRIKSLRNQEHEEKIETPIDSIDDLIAQNRKIIKEKGPLFVSHPKKLVFIKEYDLIRPEIDSRIWCSENLKKRLEDEKITGLEFGLIDADEVFIKG